MVTGDSLLTALYTAKGCGIIGRKYNTNIKIDKLKIDKGSMDGDAKSMNKAIKEEEEEDDFITSTAEKNVLVLTLLNHSNNQKKIISDSNGTKTQSGIISSSTKGDKISNKR